MIATIGLAVWLVAWLVCARKLYGRWRAMQLDSPRHGAACGVSHWNGSRCCMRAKVNRPVGWSIGTVALGAMTSAVAWPLVVVVALVRWNPPLSQTEIAERQADRDRTISELEAKIDAEMRGRLPE